MEKKFHIELIETGIEFKNIANEREIYYISHYNSLNRKTGYNSSPGGEGGNTYISKTYDEMNKIKEKISYSNVGEKNGNHTIIYMKDTIENTVIRFDSLSLCEKYLNNKGHYFSRRTYADCAKKNHEYGIQNRLFERYIFKFENDDFYKYTDYPSKKGTFPYKMTNLKTGETYIGICNECLAHFGFYGRCDKITFEKKGYIMKKLEKYEYKNTLGK